MPDSPGGVTIYFNSVPFEEEVGRVLCEGPIKSFASGVDEVVLSAPLLKRLILDPLLLVSLCCDCTTLQIRSSLLNTDGLGSKKSSFRLSLRCRIFSEPNVVLLPTAVHLEATRGAGLQGSVG